MQRKKPFHYRSPGNTVKQTIAHLGKPDFHFLLLATICWLFSGCATIEENPKKNQQLGLIATPPTYYTTQRAKYLGEKYKNHLDRLVERIVRNPKTATLQFANNIVSVGGIGFFTHSAAGSIDERFLEVIMGVPDTFDAEIDHSAKVSRVFSLYGTELLSILGSDADIYQEKEVNGYGLNLSWKNLISDATGPKISLERAVLYFPKSRVRGFLRGDLTQNALLSEAVMFAVVDNGPMKLVSYRLRESKPDSRPTIQEESLGVGRAPAQSVEQSEKPTLMSAGQPSIVQKEQANTSAEVISLSNEKLSETAGGPEFSAKPDYQSAEVASSVNSSKEVAAASSPAVKTSGFGLPVVQAKEAIGTQDSIDPLQQVALKNEPALPPATESARTDISDMTAETRSIEDNSAKQEQLASKLAEPATKEELVAPRSVPQVLQGFVIQLAFGDTREALRWAETFERRGFTVSLTEAGSSGAVRVRVGNFAGREEAERQLQALRQDGLKGILLNLPQAYRPQAQRVPAQPELSGKTVSVTQ